MENKRGRPMKIRASAFAGRTLMSAVDRWLELYRMWLQTQKLVSYIMFL